MHHDIKKIISYHNFYLFFPICKRKEFKLFQLLEFFFKNVLMHRPVATDRPWFIMLRTNFNSREQIEYQLGVKRGTNG